MKKRISPVLLSIVPIITGAFFSRLWHFTNLKNSAVPAVGRIKKGESVDLATLEKICAWIGVDPSNVLDAYVDNEASLGDQIQAIHEVNPALYEAFKKVVEKIRSGEIPPDTLREIVNFINYRLYIEPGNTRER